MRRSILSNWLGLVILGAVGFYLTRVMVLRLGDFFFGMWALADSLTEYSGLLDTGMRTAMFRYVARAQASGDRAQLNSTLATSLTLASASSLFIVALLPLVVYVLPRFFPIVAADRSTFEWTLALMGLSLAVTMPARALAAYLTGIRRFDLYNIAAVSGSALRAVMILGVLYLGYRLVAVAAVTLAAAVISFVLNLIVLRRADPEARPRFRLVTWSRVKELTSYGFFAFISNCGDQLRSYTDSTVIAKTLSVALVTPFAVAAKLISYWRQAMISLSGPLLGRLSELGNDPEGTELQPYFLKSSRMIVVLCLFCGLTLVLDGRGLIATWIGAEASASYSLLLILVAGCIVDFSALPSQMVVFALAKHRFPAVLRISEGAANLLLSIYWARRYGLMGVAWGTAVPMVISQALIQPAYVFTVTRVPPWRFAREALLRPIGAAALWFGICYFAGLRAPTAGAPHLAAVIVLQATLYGGLAYSLALNRGDRHWMKTTGRRIVALARPRAADAA